MGLRIAYCGNFEPPHSTENHIATALRYNGHEVLTWQENDPLLWGILSDRSMQTGNPYNLDFILWTRTGWDWPHYGASHQQIEIDQRKFLLYAKKYNTPVIGYHLDIWWGLERWKQVLTEPFFDVDLLITADGGHDELWAEHGIEHVWFPPAVSRAETNLGIYRDELASLICFVGSWQGSYHKESEHRHALVSWLQNNFRRDCAFWPRPGGPAIRGAALRDLYASVQVVVGDSCFVGTGLANYWSDRIPETVGRGALLLHPHVPGLADHFTDGKHFLAWDAHDWDQLGARIEWALSHPNQAGDIRVFGREHVRHSHTYERRVEQLIELLHKRDLL